MRKRKSTRAKLNRSPQSLYQQLEVRRLLATTVTFAGGSLDIDLGAVNDVAVVDVDPSGNITVNGSDQINVGGSNATVAASSVTTISSVGTSDSGQELSLVGDMPGLADVDTAAVETISFQGSYDLDNLDLLDATAVSQGVGSTLTVSSLTNIEAAGNVVLGSPSNDFNVIAGSSGDFTVEDTNSISLGQIDATGNLAVDATFIDSEATAITVGGTTDFNTVDGVLFDGTSIETVDLSVNATSDFSDVTIDAVTAFGDATIVGAKIVVNGAWAVFGDTHIESTAQRELSDTFVVDLSAADIATTNYKLLAPFGGMIIGNTTVEGDACIDGLYAKFETNGTGGGGNLAGSNAGVATISVSGDTEISTLGYLDAELSQIDTTGLTIESLFNDVILGTATTVTGDLEITSGANVQSSAVNVQGAASVTAAENILMNLVADGNVILDAGSNIDLEGLAGSSATLTAGGAIANTANSVIDVQNSLVIAADSATLGATSGDSMMAARITANVQNVLEVEQDSDVRLLNVSAGDLLVSSTTSITNRADATIDVLGDVQLSAHDIIIGQTATDTFNAGRLSFDSSNIVRINENSSTEIFGDNEARLLELNSEGDITDDANSVVDIAFSTMFVADSVTVGDTLTDTFNSRTLTFDSPGRVDVTQDSRIFLTNTNNSDQLFLSSPVSILDSPTVQVNVAGEASFETPYVNVGDGANDSFNAGSVNFGTGDRVNFNEDSDTVFSGTTDVRQVIVRSTGAISNVAAASFSTVSAVIVADGDIALGNRVGDFLDIDQMRFETPGDVTIDQDDSVFLFGNNTAENVRLIADGPIGDSPTAMLQVNGHAWFTASTIWLGEQSTDVFNAGMLTFEAAGNVVIGESSPMMLSGVNSAFNLDLTANGEIEDEAVAETIAQKSVTFTANSVTIGDTGTDCFDIVDGASNLSVNASSSTIVFGC